ncbi:hypothetical protein R3P38DRAFT_2559285 [Favolaschia claudopus]|uniref:Uncharacterized protein n=1 Tax=Favolaschia claudopus TaxID=2862362 RepID=A0AAW0A4Z8_9AGAR
MPPKKLDIWDYFHEGGIQNTAHKRAYCLGCLEQHRPTDIIDVDMDQDMDSARQAPQMASTDWIDAAIPLVKSVLGVKGPMAAHLTSCPHASADAKKEAKAVQGSNKRSRDESAESSAKPSKKHASFLAVEKKMKQPELKVFKGLDIPFNDAQAEMVQTQFLRATVSANLPFLWTTDPEVIKLFLMFRSRATEVMPSDAVLSGRLLDESATRVDTSVKVELGTKEAFYTDFFAQKGR